MKRLVGPLALLTLLGAPAEASTLPRSDFSAGDWDLTAGLFDLSTDYAVTDRLSLGASAMFATALVVSVTNVAARGTWRLVGDPDGATLGLTLSGGPGGYFVFTGQPGSSTNASVGWVQPALNASLPLSDTVRLRATLGPVFLWGTRSPLGGAALSAFNDVYPLVPNLELSFRPRPHWEVLVGGNSYFGARYTF